MIDQEEIHNQCLSKDPKERTKALDLLKANFSLLPNKQQVWSDLIRLTTDEDDDVKFKVAYSLGFVFSYVPDKQEAWSDLIRLTTDQDDEVRKKAASALGRVFSYVPDKQKAWNDLNRFTSNQGNEVIRSAAFYFFGFAFSYVPDKQKAWNDLIELINDKESTIIKCGATSALDSTFSQVPDEQKAWSDLIRLASDKDSSVRYRAAYAPISVFSQVPDKQKVWEDLIKLTSSQDSFLKAEAVSDLGSVFSYVPDKQEAWNDLIRLVSDKDDYVKYEVFLVLDFVFSQVPDKQQAWEDLIKLTNDKDLYVRCGAAYFLNSVLFYVSDKQKVWNDLHRLTNDKNNDMRWLGVSALGSVFSDMPDKQQAWNHLIRFVSDKDDYVRAYANHSLGKVSIFKASQEEKEEDYRRELENAIKFFEKSAQESISDNPAQFCLPFYRSFHTVIFKEYQSREEMDKYLVEAKDAVKGSKSKKLLLEAVENLASALQEVQSLDNLDFEAKKGELNFYRKYCDRAAELMIDTEKIAPFAAIAVRKGLPILDRNLKELIEEIQKKAKIACKEAKNTPAEYAACAINNFAKKLRIGSPEYLVVQIENLVFLLKSYIPKIEENSLILDRIDNILREEDVVIQYTLLNSLIPQIINIQVFEKTAPILSEIKYLRMSVDRLIESVDELQNPQEYLDTIRRNLEEIKNDIPEMKEKINEVLYELYSPLSTDQKLKIAIPIIPSLVSYEMETNVPKLVADKIDELKNLVLRFKKSE